MSRTTNDTIEYFLGSSDLSQIYRWMLSLVSSSQTWTRAQPQQAGAVSLIANVAHNFCANVKDQARQGDRHPTNHSFVLTANSSQRSLIDPDADSALYELMISPGSATAVVAARGAFSFKPAPLTEYPDKGKIIHRTGRPFLDLAFPPQMSTQGGLLDSHRVW